MSNKNISPELLKRYVEGNCTPEEIFLVDEWYASLDAQEATGRTFDQPGHLKKVREQIGLASDEVMDGRVVRPSFARIFRRFAAAAIFLLVAGLGTYYFVSRKQTDSIAGPGRIAVRNQTLQVRKHVFPDGSMAWLNPGAEIAYSKGDFKADSREVTLRGEAFFEVTHDASRPFFVHGESVLVKVLGTSFNVRANRGAPEYEVSVVTGKVSVTAEEGREVLLLPHQQAIYKVVSGELTSEAAPVLADKAPLWQPVSLTFRDATLGEVVQRLEEKFDVRISLENPDLANCRVKATFDQNRLSEILEMTMQIVEADYKMENDAIVISGAGCAAAE
nr:FecR domain-containing protein [uncultured Dyadobacter sp.]